MDIQRLPTAVNLHVFGGLLHLTSIFWQPAWLLGKAKDVLLPRP
jgi:hypothetical protein